MLITASNGYVRAELSLYRGIVIYAVGGIRVDAVNKKVETIRESVPVLVSYQYRLPLSTTNLRVVSCCVFRLKYLETEEDFCGGDIIVRICTSN